MNQDKKQEIKRLEALAGMYLESFSDFAPLLYEDSRNLHCLQVVIDLPSQTSLCLCSQVIMIECADLKSVINYQEVEALKHTIKVSRKTDVTGKNEEELQNVCL